MPLPPRLSLSGAERYYWYNDWHEKRWYFHTDMVYPRNRCVLGDLVSRYKIVTGKYLQVDVLNVASPTTTSSKPAKQQPKSRWDFHTKPATTTTLSAAEVNESMIKDQILDFNQLAFHYTLAFKPRTEEVIAQSFYFGKYALQCWARHHPLLYLQANHVMQYIPVVDPTNNTISMCYGMTLVQFENIVPLFAATLKDTSKYQLFREDKSQFKYHAPKETMDSVKDLVPATETPPGISWPFDLRQVHNHHYRRWFFTQNRPLAGATERDVEIRNIPNGIEYANGSMRI